MRENIGCIFALKLSLQVIKLLFYFRSTKHKLTSDWSFIHMIWPKQFSLSTGCWKWSIFCNTTCNICWVENVLIVWPPCSYMLRQVATCCMLQSEVWAGSKMFHRQIHFISLRIWCLRSGIVVSCHQLVRTNVGATCIHVQCIQPYKDPTTCNSIQ